MRDQEVEAFNAEPYAHHWFEKQLVVSALNRNQNVKGKCQMNKMNASVVFILLLTGVLAGQALAQGLGIKFNSNADDIAKIGNLLEEFRQDVIHTL